jgi:hypothetical protein
LARALPLQGRSRGFESLRAHFNKAGHSRRHGKVQVRHFHVLLLVQHEGRPSGRAVAWSLDTLEGHRRAGGWVKPRGTGPLPRIRVIAERELSDRSHSHGSPDGPGANARYRSFWASNRARVHRAGKADSAGRALARTRHSVRGSGRNYAAHVSVAANGSSCPAAPLVRSGRMSGGRALGGRGGMSDGPTRSVHWQREGESAYQS